MTALATDPIDEALSHPALTDSYEYDAYGNSFTVSGTTPNEFMYRGEQFDSDLGLYYLRARYYNPLTGRFMSRDPEDGNPINPATLHKYIYAGSNPVKYIDPTGRDLFSYAIRSSAAIPEAKLISIYGCVADAGLASVDLILDPTITAGSALGAGSAVVGCVLLTPGIGQLADQGTKIVKNTVRAIRLIGKAAGWGSCALDAEDFVNGLNDLATGQPAGDSISKSIENLGGCVGDLLGEMLLDEAKGN
jgi:RHS repeat-associated protein